MRMKRKKAFSTVLAVCMGIGSILSAGVQSGIPVEAKERSGDEIMWAAYRDSANSQSQTQSTTAPKTATKQTTTTAKKVTTKGTTTTAKNSTVGGTSATPVKVAAKGVILATNRNATVSTTTANSKSSVTTTTTAKPAKTSTQTTIDISKTVSDSEKEYQEMKAYANRLKKMSDEELAAEGMTPEERDSFVNMYRFSSVLYNIAKFIPDKSQKNSNEAVQEETAYIDGNNPVVVNDDIGDTAYRTMVWTDLDGKWRTHDIEFPISDYEYYASIQRYSTLNGVVSPTVYVNDEYNRYWMGECAKEIKQVCKENGEATPSKVLSEAIEYVQAIPYMYDDEEYGWDYPQYPIETLYKQGGDCEDTAFLLAGILRELGYDTCLFELPGHMAVGVNTKSVSGIGDAISFMNGESYYYLESTGYGWNIGSIPEDYLDENKKLCVNITAHLLGK